MTTNPPTTMRTFYIVWFGQLISMLGSNTTAFAASIWIYTSTNSITYFALTSVFYLLPMALLSPIAGVTADRYDRRSILIMTDVIQGVATLFIGVLYFLDILSIWPIYAAIALASAAQAFQSPAWSASISMIVPKEQLGRASGMGRLSQAIARMAAPAAGGALILTIGLGGIILIDTITFLLAATTLFFVTIPMPTQTSQAPNDTAQQSRWQDFVFGWRYLTERRGLLTFVIIISLLNLFANFSGTLLTPMALTMTNEATVGIMMSIMSSGMLFGALIMSAWGGPQKRIRLFLFILIIQGGSIIAIGLRPSLLLITAASFTMMLCFAFISTLIGPILQTKVAPDVQGRVFAIVGFLGMILEPLGQLVVGPLTDNFFEPAMTEGGQLVATLGPIIGSGPGRGMAVVFLLTGSCIILTGLYGFFNPRVRNLEDELPDALPDALSDLETAVVAS